MMGVRKRMREKSDATITKKKELVKSLKWCGDFISAWISFQFRQIISFVEEGCLLIHLERN